MEKGRIFNIQRYSLHDGPGIRTTVFLKGCPLNCWWCHNPESKDRKQQILFTQQRCIHCGSCHDTCSQKAIQEGKINGENCTLCNKCVDRCPTEALELVGKDMTVAEVMGEIEKDRIFFEQSKGGVTFSGGEPLSQGEFLYELLRVCGQKGIHRGVDTSGFSSWQQLEKIAEVTDLFLYDLKHINNDKHIEYTGVSNQGILRNLEKLSALHHNIYIRIPIIPYINDNDENILETSRYLATLNVKNVTLLPYHDTGIDKYQKVKEDYRLVHVKVPSQEQMIAIAEKMRGFGLNIRIGGS
ncbi:glycyl-radical enzyme activating protein family [Alkaliphilus metalliredigens QYMF]|uniref:Glycyl-radical enzyme activating protein family n=1 Tax=Alkaliphilus metalliredigens (strain QYMF) TaxID=293826 RepID=A6TKU2_ALKMQ|nr:glycyl-radical enzyme activating protein [Alkaliphilus metalliredigens]ABR46810.1 glycyl-radical enzyme activating protein family [Alkaliphilus metalliredigens QYMF]